MPNAASVTDNRTVLEKADFVLSELSSGGLLLAEQAAQFIRILINESVLMNEAFVRPMPKPKELVEKIRYNSRVLRRGTEATALAVGDRATPDLSKVELDTKLFKAETRISDEVLEDSIERGQLRQTVMEEMGKRIALDMDEIIANGDTASADLFLATLDGIRKQATSNIVDATLSTMNKDIFNDMLKTLPSEFLRNRRAMAFLTSIDADLDYRNSIADRGTALGDQLLEQERAVRYSGSRILGIPVFPENLGGGTNTTNVIYTDPKNIRVGIHRQIRVETDRDISAGVLKIVATLRFDVKYEEETAVVKAINVKVS